MPVFALAITRSSILDSRPSTVPAGAIRNTSSGYVLNTSGGYITAA